MSTRLQQAERLAEQKRIPPSAHRQLIIAERNKQIAALKARLRMAKQLLREARSTSASPEVRERITLFLA
jgi:hypothetical protein